MSRPPRLLRPVLLAALLAGLAPAWTARHGSPAGDVVPAAVGFDSAGGVCVAATVPGSGGADLLVLRYDALGALAWSDTIDGPAAGPDSARSLAVGRSGRIYVTGTVTGTTGLDVVTACYEPDGSERWRAVFDGDSSGPDRAVVVIPDRSGGCYTCASAWNGVTRRTDIVTIAYDSTGRRLWKAWYNGTARGDDSAVAATPDHDGGVLVAGAVAGAGDSVWTVLIAYAPDGRETWFDLRRTGRVSRPRAVHIDHGNNLHVTGSADYGPPTGWDCYATAYDRNRTHRWTERYNSLGSPPDHGLALATTPDTTIHVAVLSFPGRTDLTILRLLPSGGLLDWVTAGLAADTAWRPAGVITRRNRDFIAVGSRFAAPAGLDWFATCYDSLGQTRWDAGYRGPAGDDVLLAWADNALDRLALTGSSLGTAGRREVATVVWPFTGPGLAEETARPADAGRLRHPALVRAGRPLRFAPGRAAALSLRDAAGRIARSAAGDGPLELSTAGLPPGVYFLRLEEAGRAAPASRLTIVR
jgi:hypothetical protein